MLKPIVTVVLHTTFQNEFEIAIENYNKASALNPHHAGTYNNRGAMPTAVKVNIRKLLKISPHQLS